MSKIDNLKKAAFDIFGIGADVENTLAPLSAEGDVVSDPVMEAEEVPSAEIVPASRPQSVASTGAPYVLVPATYLAPGTFMEGTLRSKGDVEIAGTFKGDIISEGNVTLHTNIEGNVTANNLSLVDCSVTGDCVATSLIKLDTSSKISGNIAASELFCAGMIEGDINIKGNSTFSASAVVNANVCAGSIALERGAKISGQLNMND